MKQNPLGPSLRCSAFRGRLHGCSFLAVNPLLLKPESTRRVPKGFGAQRPHLDHWGETASPPGGLRVPGVGGVRPSPSAQPSRGRAASSAQGTPLLPASFSSRTENTSPSSALCVLEPRLHQAPHRCSHPNATCARAVAVIAAGASPRSHLVNIKGLVHQQALSLGNGAWDVQLMCHTQSNELL